MKPNDIPLLEGYMSFPDAAAFLNISKQAFHKLVFNADVFAPSDLMRFGEKPAYGVHRSAVEKLAVRRQLTETARKAAALTRSAQ